MPSGSAKMSDARSHDLADDLLAELDDAADDRDLLVFADALELPLAQQILNRVAIARRRRLDGLAARTRRRWPGPRR